MSPPLDGTYRFTNKEFPHSKLNLLGVAVLAPITGLSTDIQQWKVTNIGNDQINIQTNKTFVSVDEEVTYIGLTGAAKAYPWVALSVSGEEKMYYFKTVRSGHIWTLTSDGEYAVVVLKVATGNIPDEAKWVLASA